MAQTTTPTHYVNADRSVPRSSEARRQAEIEAGKKRFEEKNEHTDAATLKAIRARGDEELRESEEHRKSVLFAEPVADKTERDRAGAEVIDQAQTELEGVQHLADRNEPIIDMRRERIIERLEGDADPAGAREVTTDIVTAQAVNQPTVLANEAGQDTESKPLNTTGGPGTAGPMPDEALALDRQTKPDDKHVPKTRKAAQRVAKGKVPPTEKVVKEGAVVDDEDPEKPTKGAVAVVRSAPDDILGDGE